MRILSTQWHAGKKGQPQIHFPALTVAWIKLTSVWLVLSKKPDRAQRREMRGKRGREGVSECGGRDMKRGYEEENSETHSSVRARHRNALCVQHLSQERSVHFCPHICPSVALQSGLI